MKTKTTTRNALGVIALLAMSLTASAQNTTENADNIPLPAGGMNAIFGGMNMTSNVGGYANTSVGWISMPNLINGSANVSVGYGGLVQNDGNENVTVGVKSQNANTTGGSNSSVGSYALNNNNGFYNSAFGRSADVTTAGFQYATAIGAFALCNNSNRVWLGDISSDVWTANSYNVSDGRFKKNIATDKVKGLDFIMQLRPVTYNFDGKGFTDYISKNMSEDSRKLQLARDFSKSDNLLQSGFIAQEVEQAAKTAGYTFSGVHAPEGETDTYGIAYQQFVVPLVKAVQEQQQMITDMKTLISQQQQQIADLQKTAATTGINQLSANSNAMSMAQNEPNPFSAETVIKYNISEQAGNAYMAVYDLSGKQLSTIAISQKGNGSMTLTSDKLAPGIYIYSIFVDGKAIDSKRMIVAGK